MTAEASRSTAPRYAWLVWGVGLTAYILAVAGRTSLGVAGLQAIDRFGIDAAVLASFAVIQMGVYGAAQIPAGILLDRIGSRWMIAGGALLMAVGQILLGVTGSVAVAWVARVLIGLGDAATLISVLRLLPRWFPTRQVPLLTQLTSILGQVGQIVSAIPFAALLHVHGWSAAFITLGATGALLTVVAVATVREEPRPGASRAPRAAHVGLGTVLRVPGAWVGFFAHQVTLFPANAFLLLWGVPFLTTTQGVDARGASALLTLSAVFGVVLGPAVGVATGRYPRQRTTMVLATVLFSTVVWVTVLAMPAPRPFWHLALLMVTMAAGMTTCAIGFDFARTSVPAGGLGTATGLTNVGGYSASLVSVLSIGMILDAVSPDGSYTLDDFRLAFGAQVVVLAVGLAGFLIARHRAARHRDSHPAAETTGVQ